MSYIHVQGDKTIFGQLVVVHTSHVFINVDISLHLKILQN